MKEIHIHPEALPILQKKLQPNHRYEIQITGLN